MSALNGVTPQDKMTNRINQLETMLKFVMENIVSNKITAAKINVDTAQELIKKIKDLHNERNS